MAATTTTAPDVQAAFVAAANAALTDVTCWRAWPGPASEPRMVFLTETEWVDTEQAAIKSGRRHRREDYSIGFEVWSFGRSITPTDVSEAVDDAFAIYATCEGVVADAAKLGVDGVYVVTSEPVRHEVLAFDKGWAAVVTARLSVSARLE